MGLTQTCNMSEKAGGLNLFLIKVFFIKEKNETTI